MCQSKLVADSNDFLLNRFVDRYAGILAAEPHFIFFLVCGIDAVRIRSLFGGANGTDDLAGLLSAQILAQEMVGIDCNKEVTEVIRNLLAVGALAIKSLALSTVLQYGAEKLNDHSITIALVACQFFTNTAQRSKCCLLMI